MPMLATPFARAAPVLASLTQKKNTIWEKPEKKGALRALLLPLRGVIVLHRFFATVF